MKSAASDGRVFDALPFVEMGLGQVLMGLRLASQLQPKVPDRTASTECEVYRNCHYFVWWDMQLLSSILENLLVVILAIVFLVAGFYLLLLILHFGLKLKSGKREQEGLTAIWQDVLRYRNADQKE